MSGEDESGALGDLLAANTGSTLGGGGPSPLRDLSSILRDAPGHFMIDLDQAPRAIADFRHAAQAMRDLKDDADAIANVSAPGLDAVSTNVVAEMKTWAIGRDSGSLRSTLEQGAIRLEEAATALEQSLRTYRDVDQQSPIKPSPLEL